MINVQNKVPKLRFPGFEGEWEERKLGEIATFTKGKGISKSDIDETGATECIRYGELYTHYGETIDQIRSKTNADVKALILSETNDVIIPASGETTLDIATASCVLKSGVALGGDLNIIKTKNDGVFLSHYLNSKKKLEIANLAQGISVVHLYASQLRLLSVRLPRLEEQSVISKFLSLLNKRIQTQSKIIEHLNVQMLGLQEKIFKQKAQLKDRDGKVFPKWERVEGGDLFYSVSNKNHDSELPILAITQEHGAVPRDSIDFQISVTDKSVESYKVVEIGDFIISLRSFQGGIEYSNYRGICSPAYIILKNKCELDKSFYRYYFKTSDYISQLNKKLEGIRDGKMISYAYFSEIDLPFPSVEEQQVIACLLTSFERKIQVEKKILNGYEVQKKKLLNEMFI